MTGRVCVVTGANCGIGYQTAWYLAEGGNDVILACRDLQKGEAAARKIKYDLPRAIVEAMRLDLSSLASIREFVEEFIHKKKKISVLVNNAAIRLSPNDLTRKTTTDGYELTLATNYIGPCLLTHLLLDYLIETASIMGDGRIVNVSCKEHQTHAQSKSPSTEPEAIHLTCDSTTYSSQSAYCTSKLYLIMFGYHLAKKLNGTKLAVNSVDPGFTPDTELLRHHGAAKRVISRVCVHKLCGLCLQSSNSIEQAARHVSDVAASDKYTDRSGKYFINGVDDRSSLESYDTDTQRDLWKSSFKLLDLKTAALTGSDDALDEISLTHA